MNILTGSESGDPQYVCVQQTERYWAAIAVRDDPVQAGTINPDIRMYSDWTGVPWQCVDGYMKESIYSGSHVDYIMLDYNRLLSGARYPFMLQVYSGTGQFNVMYDGGEDELITQYDGSVGPPTTTPSTTFTSRFLIRVWDVYLDPARLTPQHDHYTFYFTQSGSSLRMALFPPNGLAYMKRGEEVFESSGTQEYQPSVAGKYALVVFNEGGQSGSFTLGPVTPVERSSWGSVKALYR